MIQDYTRDHGISNVDDCAILQNDFNSVYLLDLLDLLFDCLLDLSCGECYVISLYFVCCSVGVSVCLVCL